MLDTLILSIKDLSSLTFLIPSNKIEYASIAQLAEHAAVNRGVTGSSPVWGAIKKGLFAKSKKTFFCVYFLSIKKGD